MRRESPEGVAGPTQFGALIPAAVGLIGWLGIVATEGGIVGLKYAWLLVLALPLAAWTLLMRLRYNTGRFQRTIGPWRNEVDLTALQSITWKMTGGWMSRGTIFVRDTQGGCVPIYVDRFAKIDEWGPILLDAAARSGAEVDRRSGAILQQHPPD